MSASTTMYSIALADRGQDGTREELTWFLTCFVVVYPLVQAEAGPTELVYGACVLDVVAYLVFDHSCGTDQPWTK